MWHTKRLLKKDKKPRKFFLLFFSASVIMVILSLSYTYVLLANHISLLSPIPEQFKKALVLSSNTKKTNAAELTRLLDKHHISYGQISVASQSGIMVRVYDRANVFFSTQKSFAQQISSLQLINSRLTIEGKRFSMLDFRFDKPIIVLGN